MRHTLDFDLTSDLRTSAEFVVVGSGAGGGVVAQILAAAGRDVILLEAGPWFEGADYTNNFWDSIEQLYWDKGMRAMRGRSLIPTMQARCVGGTTTVNSSICFRLPDYVYEEWHEPFGLTEYTAEALAPSFDRTGAFTNIHPTERDLLGRFDLLFESGFAKLGYRSQPIQRNVRGCNGCGLCNQGCPYDAHMGTDRTYVPSAVEHGCRLYANSQVERVLVRGDDVRGVTGTIRDPKSGKKKLRFEISAKVVVLAAGVMANPVLWKRSGLPDPHEVVGKHLSNHPGIGITSIFSGGTDIGISVPQGFESSELRSERMMFETLGMPPEVAAVRMPGWGGMYKDLMSRYHNMAMWGVMVRAKGEGRVATGFGSSPRIFYRLHDDDLELMKRALRLVTEVAFEAGAEYVVPGVRGVPKVIRTLKEADQLLSHPLHPTDMMMIGNHPLGTMRMADEPSISVVDANCESHFVKNLHVIDASIFPTNLGVNPMWSIMAFADYNAHKLLQRY